MAATKKRTLGSRMVGMITRNFWLKLIALTFSLGFYGFIHSAQNAQRTLQVTVIADMPPAGAEARKELMTQIPETVTVTVVGPRQQLDTLRSEDLDPIQLNLTGAQNIPDQRFEAAQVTGLPPGVRVAKIIPSSIEIRWENVISRRIKIQAARTGEPEPGTEFVKLTVKPKTVVATGPESAVDVIQHARVEAFDITGRGVGEFTRPLGLDPPPENVVYSRNAVDVTAEIKRRLKTRELDAKIEVIGRPRATTRPANVQVRVSGPPEKVDAFQKDAVVPTVDPKDSPTELDFTKPGSASLPVSIDVPGLDVVMAPTTVACPAEIAIAKPQARCVLVKW